MRTYSMPLPADGPLQTGAVEVVRRLQAAGFTAYWAGGCVRDLILGRPPKDYDVATNALPDRVLHLFPGAVAVGKAFGVVRVPLAEQWYEVATFRTDHGYTDGRHPDAVAFADPETDARRRDFTINALFYDPATETVLDFVGGHKDLQSGVVRTVGDPAARFQEDRLRMLRAVRFAATLEFRLDPATVSAIQAAAATINTISAERIREELTRLLVETRRAGEALRLLDATGLLPPLLPEVAAMKQQAQPPEYHPEGDVFEHTVRMLDAMHSPNARLAWAVLLHDVGKPPTAREVEGRLRFEKHAQVGAELARNVLRRLRFSNEDAEAIAFMVANHMRFQDVREMRRATLRRLIAAPTFPLELELHRLDCLASHGRLDNYEFLVALERQLASAPVLPAPWITGHDIMALGVPEGPQVGQLLRKAYDRQLEGTCPDREALLAWLRQAIGAPEPSSPSASGPATDQERT